MNVVHGDNMPTRLPTVFTAVVWLMLDRFDASGVVCGIVWTLVVLILDCTASSFVERNLARAALEITPPARALTSGQ